MTNQRIPGMNSIKKFILINLLIASVLYGQNVLISSEEEDESFFYREIINDFEKKENLPAVVKDMQSELELHGFRTEKDASEYNEIIQKVFEAERKKDRKEEMDAVGWMTAALDNSSVIHFLKKTKKKNIPEKTMLGTAQITRKGVYQVGYLGEKLYIAPNEWGLTQDPQNSPWDHPLCWIPRFDFYKFLSSASIAKIEKEGIPIAMRGFADLEFAAQEWGVFLAKKSQMIAKKRQKSNVSINSLKRAIFKDLSVIKKISENVYSDNQTKKWLKDCGKMPDDVVIPDAKERTKWQKKQEEVENVITVPAGTKMKIVTDGDNLAETLLEGEVNGKTVYVSVVDYILQRLANDTPGGAKGKATAEAGKPAGAKADKKKKKGNKKP